MAMKANASEIERRYDELVVVSAGRRKGVLSPSESFPSRCSMFEKPFPFIAWHHSIACKTKINQNSVYK
jgi:hypothetical protein